MYIFYSNNPRILEGLSCSGVTCGMWGRGRVQEGRKVCVAWEELCGQIPSHFTSFFICFYNKHSFIFKQYQCKSCYQRKKGMRICFGVQQTLPQALLCCTCWLPLPSSLEHSRANPRWSSPLCCFTLIVGFQLMETRLSMPKFMTTH